MTEFPANPFAVKEPTPGRRIFTGAAVALFALALLAVAVFGVLCIGAGVAGNAAGNESIGGRLLVLAAGVLLLVMPARVAFIYLRRKFSTGNWMPSQEERLELRRRRAGRSSSGIRVFSIGVWLLVAGAWITLVVDHPKRPLWVWVSAVVWAFAAMFVIRSMKRIAKRREPAARVDADAPRRGPTQV